MKILVFVPVWKRPEITEICFMGINRLQKVPGFEVKGFAVISEETMIPLCEKYGIDWCITKNHPLGAKKNYGVSQAMRKNFDYLVDIGSDDLLKDEFLELYSWDRPVFGLMDFLLLDATQTKCKRLTTKVPRFGAGRAIRKDAITKDLWHPSATKGMDNYSNFQLALDGSGVKGVRSEDPVLVELKSEVNIHKYRLVPGKKYDFDSALNGLSEQEVNAIK
ncbi:MAG TPA: hypothetical protein VGK59_02520, partial [Ohtaekwangia sp.]